MTNQLRIVSHVGRDLLQSAQSFKTPEAAVWEYVVNSLQYVDAGIVPRVEVTLDTKAKKITIADNGAGMDLQGLQHFFTMHGENQERRKGLRGRGKFGTGKSAAFGIGNRLEVSTTRNAKRQTVSVDRAAIDGAEGDSVPVTFVEENADANGDPNGTTIVISGVTVDIKREPVVSLIERHLSAFRGSPVVVVNSRPCEIRRPQAVLSREFKPAANVAAKTGDITLTISASSAPLEASHRGVQITVGPDNLVAIETAGVDSKDHGLRLFGHVDCPSLDDPQYDPVAAYGNNRDLALNKAHPVALALTTFIGASLEQVRSELVALGKKQKAEADAKRLKETTNKIEEILNEDLKEFSDRLEGMGNNRGRRTPLAGVAGGEEDSTDLIVDKDGDQTGVEFGVAGDNHADPIDGDGTGVTGSGDGTPGGDNASVAAAEDADGDKKIAPEGGGQKRLRGGLSVDFDHFGKDQDRYYWNQETRTIVINLDHAVVEAAKAISDDEASFRRLMYEIAFTGYAIALADLQFERDPALDSSDATYEIRAALKRVWANAAVLYAA